jgi:hypothetical protein
MRLGEVPKVTISSCELVSFRLKSVAGMDPTDEPYQIPSHINLADFLQVTVGKAFRNAEVKVSEKRVDVTLRKQHYVLTFK